jgi:organic radical activating enzyme
MILFPTITLCPTLECNLQCKYCIMQCSYKHNKIYQLTLDNIDKFIYYTKKSNYYFKTIAFSGGEVLLWKDLISALEILRKENLCKTLSIATNAMLVNKDNLDWFSKIANLVDRINISNYDINIENIKLIKKNFRNKCKIADKRKHTPLSKECYNDVTPAKCICKSYYVLGSRIYICTGAFYVPYISNEDPNNYEEFYEDLKINYLEKFQKIDVFNMEWCKKCLSNDNIRRKNLEKHVPKIKVL